MTADILQAPVLVLNRHWQPISETTVQRALIDMNGGKWGKRAPKLAMHVELAPAKDGTWVLGLGTRPVAWSEWITLPVRSDHHADRILHTSRFTFRGPTVIICSTYDEMPQKRLRFSSGNVWERDGGVCQYTGEKVTKVTGNLDHVVPQDRGGKDTFENVVVARRDINSRKGNRLNHEVGLTLIRAPRRPPAVPASVTIKVARHPTWGSFLIAA